MQISEISYRAGSFITVENELESNNFFIIKSGKVKSTNSVNSISGSKILTAGDFFGVISAMTYRPRLESTYSLTDTKLILVNRKNFGVLLKKSSPLALKIIKSFSNELRIYDKILAEKTTEEKNKEDNENEGGSLFNIAKFYYKTEKSKIATYVLMQFIKFYANSHFIPEIVEMLSSIDKKNLINNESKLKKLSSVYKNNEMLFCEDEPGYEAFIIKKGRVKIAKVINDQEVVLAFLKPGDIFGEMAILNDTKRAASAIASEEDTECLVLNIENFNNIIQKNVTLAVKLISLLSERIWTIYKQIENLSFVKIRTRIYDTFFTQILTHNVKIAPRVEYLFPFGKEELGKMIGKSGQEFEKAVEQVLEDKFLEIYNDKFLCTDTLELKKETEFAKKTDKK